MKQIIDIVQTLLTFVAFGTFTSLGLMWSVNQWSLQTGFEMTFWQASSILFFIVLGTFIVTFVKNVLNYNR